MHRVTKEKYASAEATITCIDARWRPARSERSSESIASHACKCLPPPSYHASCSAAREVLNALILQSLCAKSTNRLSSLGNKTSLSFFLVRESTLIVLADDVNERLKQLNAGFSRKWTRHVVDEPSTSGTARWASVLLLTSRATRWSHLSSLWEMNVSTDLGGVLRAKSSCYVLLFEVYNWRSSLRQVWGKESSSSPHFDERANENFQ